MTYLRHFMCLSLLLVSTLLIQQSHAQNNTIDGKKITKFKWFELMQDPDARFQDVQNAFYSYWNNHPVLEVNMRDRDDEEEGENEEYESNGFYIFKRWEYINESRVFPDGKLQPYGFVKDQYEKYIGENDASASSSGNWTLQGPIAYPVNNTGQPTGMGRINAIAFHPTDANTIYIGSASGGFWKTTNSGSSWTNLSSDLPWLGVSSILIHPANPSLIYIGTGDRDGGDAPGIGVYKSTDGGASWVQSGNGMGNVKVGSMVMDPTDTNIIIAATSGGIFRTTDGGDNWILTSSNTSNYKDIKYKPNDPSIVYATEGGRFYRSSNSGNSWTQISDANGVPVAGSRMVIGVSPANPSYVYLVQINPADATFSALLRSTDSGLNFTTQSTSPNIFDYSCDGSGTSTQATYDLCIAVDPNNAEIIYVGSINNWKSTNGGASWVISSVWAGNCSGAASSVHADQHCYEWSPLTGRLYVGNDGGIYWTGNAGSSWTEISGGLSISQLYKLGQGANNVNYTLLGFQDNGSAATTNGTSFTTTRGGDGTECLIDYSNSNYCYNTYVQGDISRSTSGPTGYYSNIASTGTNGIGADETGSWVTPYMLHKTNPAIMFAGYENVFRCDNVKASSASSVSWTAISSGETSVCKVLEQSAADVNVLYIVRNGAMKRSDNATAAAASVTWTACALPGGVTPTDVEAHPTDASIVYATAGYKIYKSTDKGASWTDISGNLPSLFINCLAYDKNTNEGIYIGNQTGVWFKNADMPYWVLFSNGLPPVDVRELEIYYNATPSNNRIMAATYGRGLWQSSLIDVSVIDPTNLVAVPVSPDQVNLSWLNNVSNDNVMIAWSETSNFGSPVDGVTYSGGDAIPGGGTVLFNGSGVSYTHLGLIENSRYYYKIWSADALNNYSNGVVTDTKTPCNSMVVPFSESFTSGTIPACWYQSNTNVNGSSWQFGVLNGYGTSDPALSGNYAYFLSGYGSGQQENASLITVPLNLSSNTNVVLKFNHYFRSSSSYASTGSVYYSTNYGASWTLLKSFSSSTVNAETESLLVPGAAGQPAVSFRWNYSTTSGAYYWAIDNVEVKDCSGLWTGSVSTDWHTQGNWCNNTVPAASTDVLIPSGVTNMPYISSLTIATCKDMTIQSGASLKMATGTELDVKGNWICNGSFDYSNSGSTAHVKFNGSTQQLVGGSSSTLLKRLTVDNPAGILCTASGKQLRGDNIFLTNGIVTTGNNTVYVFGGSLTRTNGFVNGNLAKYIWTNSSAVSNITFEIGDAVSYTPVNLNFPAGSITTASSLTIKAVSGDHPNIAASTLNPYRSVNRYWSFINGGVVFSSLNAVFNFVPSDLDATTTTANLVAGRYLSSVWNYPAPGTRTATSTQLTGLTSSSLGEIQLAETCSNPDLPTIAVTRNPICAGESTVLSIASGNLNSANNWQWYSGSCGGTYEGSGASLSVSPSVNTTYYVRGEGGCISPGSCSTSALASIVVNPVLPATISILESDNQVCAGSVVTYTATVENEGLTPTFQWKVNNVDAGTNSSSFSYAPVDNDAVTCTLTSSLECASGSPAMSNTVSMHVNPIQEVSIAVSASASSVCSGIEVNYTATVTNGGFSPVLQWKVNGNDAGTGTSNFSYYPANGDIISCVLTSNIACALGNPAESNSILMQVDPVAEAGISITASDSEVCDGTLVSFTATAINGGSAPDYQWQVNGLNSGTNSSVFSYLPADGDVVRCFLTSSLICASGNPAESNAITFNVVPVTQAGVSISASSNPVASGNEVTFTAIPVNGGINPSYQWFVNGLPSGFNNITFSYIPADNDLVSCIMTSDALCSQGNPATSNQITMVVQTGKALNLKILLEGLYSANGIMNKAKGESGDQFGGNIADKISVELHESADPFSMSYSFTNLDLKTDGTVTVNVPQNLEGYYYLVVKHRNSIETWSANPVYFSSTGIVNFDFSSSASQAYGGNLKIAGLYSLIYGGDATQDGIVDGSDMAAVDNASTAILRGYFNTDVNGDGQVDGSDMAIVDNNSTGIIQVIKP